MKRKQTAIVSAIIIIISVFQFCTKNEKQPEVYYENPDLPAVPFAYVTSYPPHVAQALQQTDNTPSNNHITNDGATLGRVLFYDRSLSVNNRISCGSCHRQHLSFTDWVDRSEGFNFGLTKRKSMRLLNVRFYASGKMMWDERAATLEHQVLMPIQDSVEMGFNLTDLTKRLSEKPYYPPLFQKAFGTPEITTDRISKALAQFVRSIVTYQSKYDSVKMGLQSFTQKEAEGEQLFINNCAGCHQPPMFLTSNPVAPFGIPDPNDGGINNEGRFKVGSLRNVFEAASLFHNGSANDPYTVLQHDDGVHKLPVLEATSVRFFLQTLTDNNVRSNKMFSDPFRVR